MQVRSSLIALVGLFACAGSDEDPVTQTDGSTGYAETESAAGSTSAAQTSPTATSTTGATTSGTTTAGPTTASTSPGESSATTGSAATDDPETSGSSSGPTTADGSDTSGPETGGDDGPSAQCVELEACCDQLGSDVYTGCITVVQMANPGLCDSILNTYHQEGYCTGETYCADLGDCCAELPPGPGWQDTCEYYADFGNQPQCAMLISDYQLSDYCF